MDRIFRHGSIRAVLPAVVFISLLMPGLVVRADSGTAAFPTVPESSWVGLRLVILPQSRAVQHYGYQDLYLDTDTDYVPLRYGDYAGKIVRVVGIGQGTGPNGDRLDVADLQLEDSKKIIHGDIDHGCMNDVAPAADLEEARKRYLGKTLWLTLDHISTYDPQKDTSDAPTSAALQAAFKKVKIKQYSPVHVVDVVPGWYASAPVRFIVQQNTVSGGVQGYVDVHMSDTNVPVSLQGADRFDTTFLESDPRQEYSWSPKVWAALENREIFVGMTAQQARMSWGAPKETRTLADGAEQWEYDPHHSLILKNSVVKQIAGT